MVSFSFPTPNGSPQLVHTHKEVWVMDPHVKDKILITAKLSKPKVCEDPLKAVTKGHWTIRLQGTIGYVVLKDDHVHGIWRFELCPDENTPIVVRSLDGALVPVSRDNDTHTMIILFSLGIAIWIGGLGCIAIMQEQRDLRQFIDERLPRTFEFNPVPPGPPCPSAHTCVHPFAVGQKGDPGASLPIPIPDKAKLLPGQTLASGKGITNGEHTLENRYCNLIVYSRTVITFKYKSGSTTTDGCLLVAQHDGNLVLYKEEDGSGPAIWSSKSDLKLQSKKGFYLSEDGKLKALQ